MHIITLRLEYSDHPLKTMQFAKLAAILALVVAGASATPLPFGNELVERNNGGSCPSPQTVTVTVTATPTASHAHHATSSAHPKPNSKSEDCDESTKASSTHKTSSSHKASSTHKTSSSHKTSSTHKTSSSPKATSSHKATSTATLTSTTPTKSAKSTASPSDVVTTTVSGKPVTVTATKTVGGQRCGNDDIFGIAICIENSGNSNSIHAN